MSIYWTRHTDACAEPDQYCAPEAELNAAQIKYLDEVEGFCGVVFRPTTTQTPGDHAKMNAGSTRRCSGSRSAARCEQQPH